MLFVLQPGGAQAAQTAEEKGLMIAVEADRRDAGFGNTLSELQMILRNRRGDQSTRQMRSRVLEVEDDGDKSLVIFDSPLDVKGTAMLTFAHKTGNDDQWLYLPALKRVKRISASNRSGSFMGSEFAYEDVASEEVEKYTYKWVRDEACPVEEYGNLMCFVVERYPVDKNSGYTLQIQWVDHDEYRTVKIDYSDRKRSLLKTLTMGTYRKYLDQFWRADEMLMVNHQTGKSTQLIWQHYEFQVDLNESAFTRNSLKNVR